MEDKYDAALRKWGVWVDPKVFDLAVHFMGSVKGHTPDEMAWLAQEIQTVCQDACRRIEEEREDGQR